MIRASYRWPFHVSEPLEAVFCLHHIDALKDQWWKFVFEPGVFYESRLNPDKPNSQDNPAMSNPHDPT
jgi:hypothetical protein